MRQSLSRLSTLALVLMVAAAGAVSAEGPVITWSGFYEFNKNATSETLVMKWLGEATGTTIQPMHVEQGDMSTWWSTTLASLDLPDVMQYFGTMGDDPNIYGPQGLFVALDVEREAGNMPNLDRVYAAWDIDNYQRFAPDGHVYLANRLDTRFLAPRVPGFVLRSDLMEAAGYDPSVPGQFTDVDQVQEAILAMKPHWDAMFGGPTTGMHTRGDRGIRNSGQLPRVMYKDEFAADTAMQMEPDNVWRFGPLNPRFKRATEFLRAMHEAGILHPDYLTMAEKDQRRLDWDEGKTMFWWGTWASSIEPTQAERYCTQGTGGDQFCGFSSYPVVAPQVNGEDVWIRQRGIAGPKALLSARGDNVAAAVALLDFMYSDEGATLNSYGPEGYAWEWDDTPGNDWHRRWTLCWSGAYPKVECEENDPDRSKTRGEMIGEGPQIMMQGGPSDTWGMDWTNYYWDPADPDGRKAARAATLRIWDEWREAGTWDVPPAPSFGFSPDELDEKAQLEQQLHTYVDEQIARFINGQNNMDSDWDRFIRRIERLGAEQLEEIYNTAMNRYLDQAGIKL